MQEKYSHNANELITRLKIFYQLDSDAALCKMLGIKPPTLSSWKKRNSLDFALIFARCKDLDLNAWVHGPGKSETEKQAPGKAAAERDMVSRIKNLEQGLADIKKYLDELEAGAAQPAGRRPKKKN